MRFSLISILVLHTANLIILCVSWHSGQTVSQQSEESVFIINDKRSGMPFNAIHFDSDTGRSMRLLIFEGTVHNEPLTTNSIIIQNVARKNTEFSVFN